MCNHDYSYTSASLVRRVGGRVGELAYCTNTVVFAYYNIIIFAYVDSLLIYYTLLPYMYTKMFVYGLVHISYDTEGLTIIIYIEEYNIHCGREQRESQRFRRDISEISCRS